MDPSSQRYAKRVASTAMVQPAQVASTQERWVGTLRAKAVKVTATVPVATA